MRILDLFSGIGGMSIGLERSGMRTIAFCEINNKCREVLKVHYPHVLIHTDITKLDGSQYNGKIDVICGGYPCQPFSVAGRQRAERDPRHLWPHMLRVIQEVNPRWVICENVPGHIKLGFDTVTSQLEDSGFTVWAFNIPATACGARHVRDRLWIIGHSQHYGLLTSKIKGSITSSGQYYSQGQDASGEPSGTIKSSCLPNISGNKWKEEPLIPSFVDGYINPDWEEWFMGYDIGWTNMIPLKNRIQLLGNAVVPMIPEYIGRAIQIYSS